MDIYTSTNLLLILITLHNIHYATLYILLRTFMASDFLVFFRNILKNNPSCVRFLSNTKATQKKRQLYLSISTRYVAICHSHEKAKYRYVIIYPKTARDKSQAV